MKESKTYCLKSYGHKHYWDSIGVITRSNGTIAQVFKCFQCEKYILEFLEEVKSINQTQKEKVM